MIVYDPNTETLTYTLKLPKTFIEGLVSILNEEAGDELSRFIVKRLEYDLIDFSISKDELDGK